MPTPIATRRSHPRALPRERPDLVRGVAPAGAVLTLVIAVMLWIGFDPNGSALQWHMTLPWIPSIGASYDAAVSGLPLALILLAAGLLTVVMASAVREQDRAHAFSLLALYTRAGSLACRMEEATVVIERKHFNTIRPHSYSEA